MLLNDTLENVCLSLSTSSSILNMPSTPIPPMMPTRLRQIALVASDLDNAEKLLCNVLGTEVIFIDPDVATFGLKNILVAIGGDVIEVVSPIQPNTTAGRLLEKRGDGGYMITMQTLDAVRRRSYIESNNLGKVIHSHETPESVCIQYHPKGIKGGIMPELDSHNVTPTNPDPLGYRFSPWHACGDNYPSYSPGMKRSAHLRLVNVTCRLQPGDSDIETALRQWEDTFGIPKRGNSLQFTNVQMGFEAGHEGGKDGLASVCISVEGDEKFNAVFDQAQRFGLPYHRGHRWVDMLGVRWYFVGSSISSKL